MSRSKFKTWLWLNNFRLAWRGNFRGEWHYLKRSGRPFRVHWKAQTVDIGEVYETFDRWANSRERTVSIEQFVSEFARKP